MKKQRKDFDMKIAVISDIHANHPALLSVIFDMLEQGVNKILCLGDIIGYGPQPKECVDLVFSLCQDIVIGNHEDYLSYLDDYDDLSQPNNKFAEILKAIKFAKDSLTPDQVLKLKDLPKVLRNPSLGLTLAHASLDNSWVYYVDKQSKARKQMKLFQTPILLLGHSHKPLLFGRDGGLTGRDMEGKRVGLSREKKYVVCVGSVGQPRDHDSRACYALLEYTGNKIWLSFRRLEYDKEETVEQILHSDLSDDFAWRLHKGI